MSAATSLLSGLGEVVVGVGNAALGPFFAQVDDLSRQVEAAHATGSVPHTEVVRHPSLAAAVLGGRVGVRSAAVALVEMDKLAPRLREGAIEAVWAGFVQVVTDHGPAQATTKAALWVGVGLDDLQTRCGAGSTLGGQLLGIETIRRIACDATIIPVVLGSKSEVLDVGRAQRLFTPGLLRALWLRDKGSTISGCTAPPGWVDAHHIVHWVDGGKTSLLDGALLCGRHPPPRFTGGTPTSPPAGPDRDRDRQRSHLAQMTAQPQARPHTVGSEVCPHAWAAWIWVWVTLRRPGP